MLSFNVVIHMSLDVFHLIPQSQVIDMTGGRFGNMAFVVGNLE